MIFKKVILIKIVVLAALVIGVQSCFVAKTYKRPHFEETQNLYRTDRIPADSLSMADISWRSVFTDPYLVRYIEKGLENNIDIRMAIQSVLAAKAYAKQGKSGYLPVVTGNTHTKRSHASENTQEGARLKDLGTDRFDQFELSSLFSWEADIWGKIRSNKRAYMASYLQSAAAQKAVKTQLIADITTAYHRLLSLDAKLKVTEKALAFRRRALETIKVLQAAGRANRVAVGQYAGQLHQAQALLIDLKANIFRTENTLSILLGETPKNWKRSHLKDERIDINPYLGLPALLLRNRPDVIAAEYQLVHAFELTNVARSNFYPSFTLSATRSLKSSTFEEWFDASSSFSELANGITQPFLNRRKLKTRYEVAKTQRQRALLSFKKTLLQAGREVSDALYAYQAETEELAYHRREVKALRQAEADSKELLDKGFANYLDLLTAGQSALKAELDLIDSRLRQLSAVVSLYHALGGGWNAKPEHWDTHDAEIE